MYSTPRSNHTQASALPLHVCAAFHLPPPRQTSSSSSHRIPSLTSNHGWRAWASAQNTAGPSSSACVRCIWEREETGVVRETCGVKVALWREASRGERMTPRRSNRVNQSNSMLTLEHRHTLYKHRQTSPQPQPRALHPYSRQSATGGFNSSTPAAQSAAQASSDLPTPPPFP